MSSPSPVNTNIPSIPMPQADLRALLQTCLTLRQAVQILAGSIGGQNETAASVLAARAVTFADLALLGLTTTTAASVAASIAVLDNAQIVTGSVALANDFAGTAFVKNTSGAAIQVILPSPATRGQTVNAVDSAGNAGTYTITWKTSDGSKIAGATTKVFNTNYQSVSFAFDGTNWSIIQ